MTERMALKMSGHLSGRSTLGWACRVVLPALLLALNAQAQVTTSDRSVVSTQLGAVPLPWMPAKTEVFASSAMYISNPGQASVYLVDARKLILAEINRGGLPPDPKRAAEIARERFRAMGPDLKQRVTASLRVTEKVIIYGIQRVPAVVFDGQRVVYGVSDVAQATEIARRGGAQQLRLRFNPGGSNTSNIPKGAAR